MNTDKKMDGWIIGWLDDWEKSQRVALGQSINLFIQ